MEPVPLSAPAGGVRKRRAEPDYLREYLARAPAALALLRAIECRECARLSFARPMLDLGCGDGLFGQILFGRGVEAGLDHSASELRRAARRGVYRLLVRAPIARIPFAGSSFATVFSNGVLEHVDDLDQGLRELRRVLRPGGRLIFTVPTPEAEAQLGGAALLRRLGWQTLARRYVEAYNRCFRQVNVWPLEAWRRRLEANGWAVLRAQPYAASGVFRWHDALLPAAALGFAQKSLTGKWSCFPRLRRAFWSPLWSRLLGSLYRDSDSPGCSLLLVAQR